MKELIKDWLMQIAKHCISQERKNRNNETQGKSLTYDAANSKGNITLCRTIC